MTARAICRLATPAIATLKDVPDRDDTGQVGERYANARAAPGLDYYLETTRRRTACWRGLPAPVRSPHAQPGPCPAFEV